MPSRKRNKGKERKAKKAELEAEKIRKEREAARSVWLKYARGVEEDGRVISKCNHGCDLMIPDEDNHPVTNFLGALFIHTANKSNIQIPLAQYLVDTFTTYQEVWDNARYRAMAVNIFIAVGTNFLLQNERGGYFLAHAIVILENYDGEGIVSTLYSCAVATKVRDLGYAGTKRDLLKFYRKRVSCSCLRDMHLHARKTQPKTGGCFHCKQVKERALLMVCSRCRINQYCSMTCQYADWLEHRSECDLCLTANAKTQKLNHKEWAL